MSISNDKKNTSADDTAREIGFAENFTNAARETYLNEHKNPGRVGCFTGEAIRRTANSGKLPDDSLMNHLFDCSECFREYRRALLISRETSSAEKSVWSDFFAKARAAKLIFAGACSVLLIGLIFLSLWIFREDKLPELARNIEISNEPRNIKQSETKTDENIGSAENNLARMNSEKPENIRRTDNSSTKNQPRKIENNQRRQARAESVTLILSGNNVLRNAVNSNETGKIILPARKIDLNIELSEGFSDGLYKLKIVDAFGGSLLEKNSTVKKRKLSLPNLDLKNLGKRAYKICLQSGGEMPECFDIKIGK